MTIIRACFIIWQAARSFPDAGPRLFSGLGDTPPNVSDALCGVLRVLVALIFAVSGVAERGNSTLC